MSELRVKNEYLENVLARCPSAGGMLETVDLVGPYIHYTDEQLRAEMAGSRGCVRKASAEWVYHARSTFKLCETYTLDMKRFNSLVDIILRLPSAHSRKPRPG